MARVLLLCPVVRMSVLYAWLRVLHPRYITELQNAFTTNLWASITRTHKLRQHWDRFRVSVGILLGEMTSICLPEHSPGRVNSISLLPPSLQSGSILGALHYYIQGTRVLTWLAVFRTGVFWDKEATDGCISPSGHQTRGSVYLFQAESLLNWIIVIFQLSVRPEITKNLI